MAGTAKIAILVVVLVIVAVVGYAAYAGYIPGIKSPSSTASTAPNMSIVSSDDLNSTMGGGWNQVANFSFSSTNFSFFLNAAMNLSSQSSLTSGASSLGSSALADQTVGQVESVELVDFYSSSGLIAAGYAHFKTNLSASNVFSALNLAILANASLKSNYSTGTLSGYNYFTLNATSGMPSLKIYTQMLVSNYGGEIIVIYHVSTTAISLSNSLSLLSKEFNILKTYGAKTNGAPLIVSRSTVNTDLGLNLNNSIKIGTYINSPILLSKELNFTANLTSGNVSVGQLNISTKSSMNVSLSPNMIQSAIYFRGGDSLFGAAIVKFNNNTDAANIYTNVSNKIVAYEVTYGSMLSSHLHWDNASGFVYFNYSYVNQTTGQTHYADIGFGHAGSFVFVVAYLGTTYATNAQFANLIQAQASLL